MVEKIPEELVYLGTEHLVEWTTEELVQGVLVIRGSDFHDFAYTRFSPTKYLLCINSSLFAKDCTEQNVLKPGDGLRNLLFYFKYRSIGF